VKNLTRAERMLLLRFVCACAWADREIRAEERDFVWRLVRKLELNEAERREVDGWLASPDAIEPIDPAAVPEEHRRQFLHVAESVIAADGEIARAEQEQLLRFARRLRDS
jgi:tellurite resistance protein